MEFTQNEMNVLEELKNYPIGFATPKTLQLYVLPSTANEVRFTIYSLIDKGVPIRDVGAKDGGWRLESPRVMVRHYLDLIKKSQDHIEKIMRFSNERYEKFIEDESKK